MVMYNFEIQPVSHYINYLHLSGSLYLTDKYGRSANASHTVWTF